MGHFKWSKHQQSPFLLAYILGSFHADAFRFQWRLGLPICWGSIGPINISLGASPVIGGWQCVWDDLQLVTDDLDILLLAHELKSSFMIVPLHPCIGHQMQGGVTWCHQFHYRSHNGEHFPPSSHASPQEGHWSNGRRSLPWAPVCEYALTVSNIEIITMGRLINSEVVS